MYTNRSYLQSATKLDTLADLYVRTTQARPPTALHAREGGPPLEDHLSDDVLHIYTFFRLMYIHNEANLAKVMFK